MSGALDPSRPPLRPVHVMGLAALVGLLGLAYAPTFEWLAARYRAPDTLYGHGPLVPLVSGYLVWRRRAELVRASAAGDARALSLVVPALLLHLLAVALRVDFGSGVSLWLLVAGLCWLLWGAPVLSRVAFPWAFLGFAIPVPMVLVAHAAQVLKQWVIGAAGFLLEHTGTGVRTEGSYLLLPGGGRLLVDDECSGLRSIIALLALGTVMAATAGDLTRRRRGLVAALAVPVALLANLLRVILLSLIGAQQGPEAAARWHDVSGWGVYAITILCYVVLERRLRRGALGTAAKRIP